MEYHIRGFSVHFSTANAAMSPGLVQCLSVFWTGHFHSIPLFVADDVVTVHSFTLTVDVDEVVHSLPVNVDVAHTFTLIVVVVIVGHIPPFLPHICRE